MAQVLKEEKENLLSDPTDAHNKVFADLAKVLQEFIFDAGFEQALAFERAKIEHDAEHSCKGEELL